MKFQAERSSLIKALAHIQSVVERRNTVPILANVMIEYSNGRIHLTATDMEILLVEVLEAEGTQDGAVTVAASVLYEIVRKLPDDVAIELEHAGGTAPLALRAGRYVTSLNVLPVEDFPTMVTGDLSHNFKLPSASLRRLIDRTRFAVSTEETRYYLNGIYLHIADVDGKPALRAVATDGHRLARTEIPAPPGAPGMPGVIIPRKTISELRKLLDEGGSDVLIKLSDTIISFEREGMKLTSKLIDGTFPEYERVIPKGNDRILRVSKSDFATAVGRVAAISTERSRPVKLALRENVLTLTAQSQDQGTATEELTENSVAYNATPLEIGFQARYLHDITDQIDSEVVFSFADNAAPVLVTDSTDENVLFVLMPMRV
ncbi:DNA polymerase III subunit beta [Candidatus Kirkpatrickella diaphorinae]|uniref:Beta sliding clamp n=1 Tax=Candidatus Kirkpatrickella diaphorinae TaxID=2984322 RepID=A0ABY6GJY2_9PROT|nr:DNA polymerase III subunit beta [Candidatus Kirkpatrickella diaphorinae]UYH51844.1 DNA polymerase III subunit beta [Candidatus Kirkpatrickella diaphorinae]